MKGTYGTLLRINAESQRVVFEPIDESPHRSTLGGKGLAIRLLLEHNPPGVDPFSPENCLIVATGPVSGSPVWGSCRYGI